MYSGTPLDTAKTRGCNQVGLENQFGMGEPRTLVDPRRHPRFKFETDIRVYARDCTVVRGRTVDISQSGISAMLRVEVPLGEVVRLEFTVPGGEVEIHAVVRQRNAFRYGFQFLESSSAQDLIGHTCRDLALAKPE
jgi:PilZ domain